MLIVIFFVIAILTLRVVVVLKGMSVGQRDLLAHHPAIGVAVALSIMVRSLWVFVVLICKAILYVVDQMFQSAGRAKPRTAKPAAKDDMFSLSNLLLYGFLFGIFDDL